MRFALNKSTDVLTKGAHGRIQDYYYRKKKTDRRKRRAARKRRR